MQINYVKFNDKFINSYKTMLDKVFETTLETLGLEKEFEFNLMNAKKGVIKKINKLTRGVNKVTDVLSFPNLELKPTQTKQLQEKLKVENLKIEINPETNNVFLGDVMICLKVVTKQAKEFENTFERELSYMVVHGILHLLGYDHMQEKHKKEMRKVEEQVLGALNLTR